MKKRVEAFIRENALFYPGDRILAAVSGGADSVCLLDVLKKLQAEWNLELRAVHVNHQIRAKEAERDENFVKNLCRRFGVECICHKVKVRAFAQKEGLSEEEAGRTLRYQVLEEEAKKWEKFPCSKQKDKNCAQDEKENRGKGIGSRKSYAENQGKVWIAVAHHRDDNVETVLFNLFRGSGLKGLGGIPAARGRIIRPLLCVGRKEILTYLLTEGLDFCVDSTNASGAYTRNRLRHRIIPEIETQVNERAAEHILQAAKRARQADNYLEEEAKKWLKQFGERKERDLETEYEAGKEGSKKRVLLGFGADIKRLQNESEILQTYVLKRMIEETAGQAKDLGEVHIQAVRRLFGSQTGKRVDLPYGLTAQRMYTMLWVERAETGAERKAQEEVIFLPKPEMEIFSYEKGMEIPQNQYTKWFDCDKIKGMLSVRTRQTGDYFFLPGGKRKTIKAYMVDEKIPAVQRGRIPLLADGNHILWIIGKRISEGCKVTDKTKTILQVHVRMADK